MEQPLISVSVLNYNGEQFIRDNLNSLKKQSYKNIEIFFIDNGSADNSLNIIKDEFPEVILIENPANTGYVANNLAVRKAKGKYILLLNNDTIAEENFIEEFVKTAESCDQSVGMWTSKVMLMNEDNRIDSIGINIYPDGMTRQRGRMEEDLGQYDRVEEILLPSGSAGFYRKEMLDEIGLLDEDFFAYCEDSDLGFRGRLAGWKAYTVPTAKVYHYYSGTAGSSHFKVFHVERNHIWFAVKCFPLSILLQMPFYTFYRFMVQLYGVVSKKGIVGNIAENESKVELIKTILKAYFSALKGLGKKVKERKEIMKNKKASNKEILQWFKEYKATAQDLVLRG